MAKRERVFLGLYCGEAADGVDAAVVSVRGKAEKMAVTQGRFLHRPLPDELRKRVRSAAGGWSAPAEAVARLQRAMAVEFAAAGARLLREDGLRPGAVEAAGVVGPLAGYVRPAPATGKGCALELADGGTIAGELGLPVAAGFAAADLAAGGVGGPVCAWPNWLLFRHDRLSRVVVHLGAVATMTFVGSAAAACEVVAYDVGPGTAVLDAFARELYRQDCDEDGALAARGTVHEPLLNELGTAEFFQRDPPKRSWAGEWGSPAVQRVEMMAGKHRCAARDLLATLTELTARTVAANVLKMTERPHEVILSGGGAKNIHLAGRIRTLLSPCSTYTAERYGLGLKAAGAVGAAVLAAARMDGFAAHCPAATGAEGPVVLGGLWQP